MEQDIIHMALNKFEEITNLKTEVIETEKFRIDGIIHILEPKIHFTFEVKSNIQSSNLPKILSVLKTLENALLISEYIAKPAREQLRKANISYIDTAGNTYLKQENLFVYIETHKNNKIFKTQHHRAFSKTGLKVLYHLLIQPELLNKPYRDIAEVCKVSIDTISKVLKNLLKEKYIIQIHQKQYEFLDKEKLFQEWVTLFNKVLRPKLKQRTFKLLKEEKTFRDLELSGNGELGGAYAGELLSDYLIAETAYIYTERPFIDLMKVYKLIPDESGNIVLIEKFWHTTNNDFRKTVHPILVYADLVNQTSIRNTETAQKIYDQYIKNIL